LDKKWEDLNREEKRERRLSRWLNPGGINFKTPEAEKNYKARLTRLLDTFQFKKTDRVPVSLPSGFFPAYYAGWNLKRVMNDYAALKQAWLKFVQDFADDMDDCMGPALVFSAPALETVKYLAFKWPGHGLGDDVNTYQYIEDEYMKAEEYPALLKDPADFSYRVVLPRAVGALQPLRRLPSLAGFMSMPLTAVYPFMNPEIRAAYQALIEAGKEMEKWQKYVMEISQEIVSYGFPGMRGGLAAAPFDVIADFLRGTQGTVMDMYRQPEALLEAIEMFTETTIPRAIAMTNATQGFVVNFPLHKGDDTFMSEKQFEKFYWPSLKRVIDALIEDGIMVSLFAEGRYNRRLQYIGDFPKGWVRWQFDQTDMAEAKKIVGRTCSIAGNVPASVILTGTPAEVKDCCRKLIEVCAPGGGYFLTGGATATEARAENLRAFMQAAREYGRYA
jgi:uroporphyrinogen-III decarboxylase